MNRYLTKSRFKLALECETKLFYTHKDEYCDQKVEDSFLEALAEGGFQVGELAKCYYPGGVMIDELNYESSLQKTNQLLSRENVVIFEAAVKFENLFVRIDILIKEGQTLHLIEVKSKSFDGQDQTDFLKKRTPEIATNWRPYVYDVAFQKLVLKKAFPDYEIHSYLMLTDKNKVATVDGLNQLFRLVKENGRNKVVIDQNVNTDRLGEKILAFPYQLCPTNTTGQSFTKYPRSADSCSWTLFRQYEPSISLGPGYEFRSRDCQEDC